MSRPELAVNLISAILVLLVGFYAILFVPLAISTMMKVLIGGLLILYFLFRMKLFLRKYHEAKGDIDRHDHNKILDNGQN
ncbi:hypothetical protein TRIP_C60405 [Candidatus Zixiibacteriota bacterium]|nr:hypothetical protein TRIP_C60405 [candidate division Zixibacteria bacterium]